MSELSVELQEWLGVTDIEGLDKQEAAEKSLPDDADVTFMKFDFEVPGSTTQGQIYSNGDFQVVVVEFGGVQRFYIEACPETMRLGEVEVNDSVWLAKMEAHIASRAPTLGIVNTHGVKFGSTEGYQWFDKLNQTKNFVGEWLFEGERLYLWEGASEMTPMSRKIFWRFAQAVARMVGDKFVFADSLKEAVELAEKTLGKIKEG